MCPEMRWKEKWDKKIFKPIFLRFRALVSKLYLPKSCCAVFFNSEVPRFTKVSSSLSQGKVDYKRYKKTSIKDILHWWCLASSGDSESAKLKNPPIFVWDFCKVSNVVGKCKIKDKIVKVSNVISEYKIIFDHLSFYLTFYTNLPHLIYLHLILRTKHFKCKCIKCGSYKVSNVSNVAVECKMCDKNIKNQMWY